MAIQQPMRVNTGIDNVDEYIGGGIPPGALVTCSTESTFETETFLHQILASPNTESLYISTIGNEEAINAELQKSAVNVQNVDIEYVEPSGLVQGMKDVITQSPETEVTVINTVNWFESGKYTDTADYQVFLNWLQNRCRRTEGIVVFNRYRDDTSLTCQYLTNTMSDIVFTFEEQIENDEVTKYLHIPKCRSTTESSFLEKIEIKNRVTIDTTRDIG